jgi:hypothetical protein
VAAVHRLLTVDDNWVEHTVDLDTDVNSSGLGQSWFGHAIASNVGHRVQSIIEQTMEATFGGVPITSKVVQECRDAIHAKLKDLSTQSMPTERDIQIEYAGDCWGVWGRRDAILALPTHKNPNIVFKSQLDLPTCVCCVVGVVSRCLNPCIPILKLLSIQTFL